MEKDTVQISFPDAPLNEAGVLANSLKADLQRAHPEFHPEVSRTDPEAQDLGTTVVLILGAPAAVILANAVRDWMRRKNRGQVTINGTKVDIRGVESDDIATIIKAIKTLP